MSGTFKAFGILIIVLTSVLPTAACAIQRANEVQIEQQFTTSQRSQIDGISTRTRVTNDVSLRTSKIDAKSKKSNPAEGGGKLQARGSCVSCSRRHNHGPSEVMLTGVGRPGGFPKAKSQSTQGTTSSGTSREASALSIGRPSSSHPLNIPPSIAEMTSAFERSNGKARKAKSYPDTTRNQPARTSTSGQIHRNSPQTPRVAVSMRSPKTQHFGGFDRAWSDPVDRAYGSSSPRGRVIGTSLPRARSGSISNGHASVLYTSDDQHAAEIVDGHLVKPGSLSDTTGSQHGLQRRGMCLGKPCGVRRPDLADEEVPLSHSSHLGQRPLTAAMEISGASSTISTKHKSNASEGRLRKKSRPRSALDLTSLRDNDRHFPWPKGGKSKKVRFDVPAESP